MPVELGLSRDYVQVLAYEAELNQVGHIGLQK